MKTIVYLTALLSALVLTACATSRSPLQEISDARSAVAQATKQMSDCNCEESDISTPPCDCDVLKEAQAEVSRAEMLLHNGDKAAASRAAHNALNHSQNLLRELHRGSEN